MQEKKVERAVILAAGIGSRMKPITDNLPKPLVKVLGKRIIETSIDALLMSGINDIYIVCGYLADKFQCLAEKYPNLKFVLNEHYKDTNNISSIISAGNLVENAYIIEGDLFLRNSQIITANQAETNYLGIYTNSTNDWCFDVNDAGYITKIAVGGKDCYQMVGISYWTAEDGKKLIEHANKVFQTADGKNKYWDEIALKFFAEEYKIKIRNCSFEDVTEIDTLKELQAIDSTYKDCEAF